MDWSRAGVSVGKEAWNVLGECVEKKSAKKERHVKCKVDVVVVGGCERTDFEVETIRGT